MPTGIPEKKSKELVPTKHLMNLNIKKSKQNMSARIPEKKVRKEITLENPSPKSESESNNSEEELLER